MKALDPLCIQMMSIEKSALNKICSSGSKLYSSLGHLLCCSPLSPQFFWRPLWFLLGTLFYRNLAFSDCSSCPMLELGWMTILFHIRQRLLKQLGIEPCHHLIHVIPQARSELDSFWMKQNWKMCPRSLPNAVQLLVGTRSMGQADREPSNRGTAWCQVLSTELSCPHRVLRSRTTGSGGQCLPFSARCCWATSECFT